VVFEVKYGLKIFTFLTILLAGGILAGGILTTSDDTCAAKDGGTFYSYTVSFSFTGERGIEIEWDFGDGTSVVNKWIDVEHTYEAKGTYIVKQTVTNNIGTDTAEMVIQIEGHPKITFISGDLDFRKSILVPYINGIPQVLPASVGTPTITGQTFEGWYYDIAYTQKWTPEDKMDKHKTLYAKWIDGIYVDEVPSMTRIISDMLSTSVTLNYYIPTSSMFDLDKGHDLPSGIFSYFGDDIIVITVYDDVTKDTIYSLTFSKSGELAADHIENIDLRIELIQPEGEDLEAAKENGATKAIFLKFYSSGILPYGIDIEYYVGDHYTHGTKVDLVYMNEGKLTDEVKELTISNNGTIRFTLEHCSTYAVLGYGQLVPDSPTYELSTLYSIAIVIILILIIAILFIIFAIRRKKETDEINE